MSDVLKSCMCRYLPSLIIKIVLLFLCSHLYAGESLKVGLPVPGPVPFMWVNQQGDVVGIFADTIRLIAQDIDVDVEFVSLSQARLVKHFIAGEIDIEMGVSKQKNESSEMTNASVFSQPFGFVNSVVIYNKSLKFSTFILKDLKGKKVAAVRGVVSPDYIDREDFASPLQIAKRVDRGWSELGLMSESTAMHYKFNQGMNYKISLPYKSDPIRIRLHIKHNNMIEKINNSIIKFKKEGRLENIICDYLCGD